MIENQTLYLFYFSFCLKQVVHEELYNPVFTELPSCRAGYQLIAKFFNKISSGNENKAELSDCEVN